MAKLKCDKHNRRVVVADGKIIHKTGSIGICDSDTATIKASGVSGTITNDGSFKL